MNGFKKDRYRDEYGMASMAASATHPGTGGHHHAAAPFPSRSLPTARWRGRRPGGGAVGAGAAAGRRHPGAAAVAPGGPGAAGRGTRHPAHGQAPAPPRRAAVAGPGRDGLPGGATAGGRRGGRLLRRLPTGARRGGGTDPLHLAGALPAGEPAAGAGPAAGRHCRRRRPGVRRRGAAGAARRPGGRGLGRLGRLRPGAAGRTVLGALLAGQPGGRLAAGRAPAPPAAGRQCHGGRAQPGAGRHPCPALP